jgi:AbrB family looped-hinge helix DNA binding protein
MATSTVKVGTQYQISTPKQACRQLKIKGGDHLLLAVWDGMMILIPLHGGYTQTLAGLHSEIWWDSDEYILRERNAWIDSTKS